MPTRKEIEPRPKEDRFVVGVAKVTVDCGSGSIKKVLPVKIRETVKYRLSFFQKHNAILTLHWYNQNREVLAGVLRVD